MNFARLFCLCLVSQLPSIVGGAERVAFVVGNNAYIHARPLKTAVADAEAVAEKLRAEFGFKVILKTDATRDQFSEAIAEFLREARKAEAVFVYFAGHGIESTTMGGNFLIPTDAVLEKEEHLDSQGVSLNSLIDKLRTLSAPVRLLTLDCCRNNPLEGRAWSGGRGAGEGLGALDLQRLDAATMVVYSAAPGKAARDQIMDSDRHSPFAAALLGEIDKPGANALSVFAGVEDAVFESTAQTQHPKVFVSGNLAPFQRFIFRSVQGGAQRPSLPAAEDRPPSRPTPDDSSAPRRFPDDLSGSWIINEVVTAEQGGWKIDWRYQFTLRGDRLVGTGRKFRVNGAEPTRGERVAVSEFSLRWTGTDQFEGTAVETNFRLEKINASVTIRLGADGRSLSGDLRQGGEIVSRLTGSLQD